MLMCQEYSEAHYGHWEDMEKNERERWISDARKVLGKVAPFIAFHALMEAADAAQADELTTAGEVIYDLRVRAAQELAGKP